MYFMPQRQIDWLGHEGARELEDDIAVAHDAIGRIWPIGLGAVLIVNESLNGIIAGSFDGRLLVP